MTPADSCDAEVNPDPGEGGSALPRPRVALADAQTSRRTATARHPVTSLPGVHISLGGDMSAALFRAAAHDNALKAVK